mgnify:CR=1 FL=1
MPTPEIGETDEAMARRPDWRMIPPSVRELYLGARTKYWRTAATEARRRRYVFRKLDWPLAPTVLAHMGTPKPAYMSGTAQGQAVVAAPASPHPHLPPQRRAHAAKIAIAPYFRSIPTASMHAVPHARPFRAREPGRMA